MGPVELVEPAGALGLALARRADALATQRDALNALQLAGLPDALAQVADSYAALEVWPGGMAGLPAALNQCSPSDQQAIRQTLAQAAADHRICGELIRVALQRVASLQAFQVQGSAAATYAPGQLAGPGGRLSTRA